MIRTQVDGLSGINEATLTNTPPAYTVESSNQGNLQDIATATTTAAFADLNLSDNAPTPSRDECLAHLRLLFLFQELKNSIGYRDGLWDIWDSRAINRSADDASRDTNNVLAVLREKRWAIYVTRAVDRYESWWKSFVPDMLKESDMTGVGSSGGEPGKYTKFVSSEPMIWKSEMLPPPGMAVFLRPPHFSDTRISNLPPILLTETDVLLIWHSHMLNPRLMLEVGKRRKSFRVTAKSVLEHIRTA
jgi:hypothetical protein